MSTDKCFICDTDVNESSGGVVRVGEKGIEKLKKASIQRQDQKFQLLENITFLKVHTACRKNYIRPQSINAALKTTKNEPTPLICGQSATLRSSVPKFDFKNRCFLCTDLIDEQFKEKEKKKPIPLRRIFYEVRVLQTNGPTLTQRVLEAAEMRNDQWGEEVKIRLSNVVDLIAADGIYHLDCLQKFYLMSRGGKRGRPETDYVAEAMEEICSFLENNDDCQHALSDLLSAVTGRVPDEQTVKTKLKQRYGESIIITKNPRKIPSVCFIDTGMKVLSDAWYENKKKDCDDERLRIVQTAAAIIREDIQSKVYDFTSYPPSNDFFKDAKSDIPKSLSCFLENVLMKKKSQQKDVARQRKCITIGHAIISAVRPKSFVSPILTSLGVLLYRKYGHKNLVDLISNLGFCSSYYESRLLEMSAIQHGQPDLRGMFCQFIYDNADFNVSTLDGLNTFHSMVGIKCVTPAHIESGSPIMKLTKMPIAEAVEQMGVIPLKPFELTGTAFKNVKMDDLGVLAEDIPLPNIYDTLWMYAKWMNLPGVPEWKGFMQSITKHENYEKTKVIPLPFINAPPSNYDTIYTALQYAADVCVKMNQRLLFITFDQPLYLKCREIVAASPADPVLSKCVVRLGGFHLLMSYLGCIGFIMDGSGLKELLETIYAPLSVEKMLQGHAYSRAVRAHLLVQTALAKIVLQEVETSDEELQAINEVMETFAFNPPLIGSINQNTNLQALAIKLGNKLTEIKGNGRTAALWIQYFNMVTLMKEYISAERSGNWNGHLKCVQQMIPFFHACGHFPYAKSCHLYLQDMLKLPSMMTEKEFKTFTEDGYFTIRRTDSFWTGVWSDMCIEQTLIRSMKSTGGLTRGRGITDSVLSKFVLGVTATHGICVSLEEFSGVLFVGSEQHVDFRKSTQARDIADVEKLSAWFQTHPPFPLTADIMSIANGVVGDVTINCYDAINIGKQAMAKVVGKCFSDIKLSRKDRALPLAIMNCSVKIHDCIVPVNPLVIFQRISIAKQHDEDLENYLKFELAPFPLALFDEGGMRKTKKAVLYNFFKPYQQTIDFQNCDIVVDGGFLLHKVPWSRGSTFNSICEDYTKFIFTHYKGKSCTVVFDGYFDTTNSTKSAEQNRRCALKKSVDINFNKDTAITVKQENFLSNEKNKSRLIAMLSSKLKDNGIPCRESTGDADTLIVTTAIEKSSSSDRVAVVGEDVDLLVLLIALTPIEREIFFVKPSRGKIERKVFSTQQIVHETRLKDVILVLHAFTGCDTTSAVFKKGKINFFKLFQHCEDVHKIANVFNSKESDHDAVAEAGNRLFLRLYGAPSTASSLNTFRYHSFAKSVSNVKPDISSLPPTEGAARQHSFRVYHQVQLWLGQEQQAELWGWERRQNHLIPITTKDPIAPEAVLNTIFCKCTTGCGAKCGCRKAAMNCTIICNICHGDCLNSTPKYVDQHDEEKDEDSIMNTILLRTPTNAPSTSADDNVSKKKKSTVRLGSSRDQQEKEEYEMMILNPNDPCTSADGDIQGKNKTEI